MSNQLVFKYIVIGDSGVGKSCLLLKFADNRFRPDHDLTIGVEFGSKQVQIDGQNIHLQIWDTAGQQSFRSITRAYYRGSTAAFLVYDVTRRGSFNTLNDWMNEIASNATLNIVTILIGNKTDLDNRVISEEEGRNFASENNLLFIETSAKTGNNVEEAFESVTREVYSRVVAGQLSLDANSVTFKAKNKPKEKKKCC